MPRTARVKTFESIFHVMVRSISHTPLYRKFEDKDKYLELFKKYQDILGYKVYAYCLMDTHAHFIVDANGADISRIMHGINQTYAQYFNRKYGCRGHLFADRFKSIIVNDDRYLITLSGYIHNNPHDIEGFKEHIEAYQYSSLGLYLGLRRDNLDLVDTSFVMQLFGRSPKLARGYYLKFVKKCDDAKLKEEVEFNDPNTEYRSERIILARNYKPKDIVTFVSGITSLEESAVTMKHNKGATEMRALCVLLMRCLCNYRHKDICAVLGGLSQSRVSALCSMAFEMVYKKGQYEGIVQKFLKGSYASA